jgi:16S rRNA (cytidine1402-2'-O)-methyltransferase
MSITRSGTLYIVATPIGNLGDISQRALDTLQRVDRVLAEDTRNTRKLLTHFGIQATLLSLHEHNESERSQQILQYLQAGENLALVSDAGTPLISDPGYHLVNVIADAACNIVPIPGPSALITALSVAGLPTERFVFEGFLPAKPSLRRKKLQETVNEPRTHIFYESSHRIAAMLEDMENLYGAERHIVLARELTKLYEDVFRGNLGQLTTWISSDDNHRKGEFVVIVAGKTTDDDEEQGVSTQKILKALVSELPVKQAANLTAQITGKPKNDLYRQAMTLKKQQD